MSEPILPTDSTKSNDLTGKRFFRLVALYKKNRGWLCQCDCGNTTIAFAANLRTNAAKSCGCLRREREHGKSQGPEYRAWSHAIDRCENPNCDKWRCYGARGIRMCQRWRESFSNFYADMGPRPSDKHSLDRIDVNGNYEPGNCRWATWDQQMRNTRVVRLIEFNGVQCRISELAQMTGIAEWNIKRRLREGLSIEEVVACGGRKVRHRHARVSRDSAAGRILGE